MRTMKLSAKVIDGLEDLLALIEGLQDVGWEGTPFDHNYEEPEDDTNLGNAITWLNEYVADQKEKRARKV